MKTKAKQENSTRNTHINNYLKGKWKKKNAPTKRYRLLE